MLLTLEGALKAMLLKDIYSNALSPFYYEPANWIVLIYVSWEIGNG